MSNIIDYVRTQGAQSLQDLEFSKEDALVLAEFCYLKFERILDEMSDRPVSLQKIRNSEFYESMFTNFSHEKEKRALLEAMSESVRFKNLKVCMYINRIDVKDEMQFCALTFLLPNGETYIGFRGTDETIVGWQEDINMALERPIRGQKLSAKYVNDVAMKISGQFMIGGHSKGGNLAMYSAMNCSKVVQRRIKAIYSFDGPGFRKEFLEKYGFDNIREKLVSVIPKSSYVGLLLSTDENSIVVASKSVGVRQHNPYNWVVADAKLEETRLSEQHLLLLDTFNEWMCGLDEEHLNAFVKILTEVLNATEATDTRELSADIYGHALKAVNAAKDLDEETKEFLKDLLKTFAVLMKDRVISDVSGKIVSTRDDVSLKLESGKEEITVLVAEARKKLKKIRKKKGRKR